MCPSSIIRSREVCSHSVANSKSPTMPHKNRGKTKRKAKTKIKTPPFSNSVPPAPPVEPAAGSSRAPAVSSTLHVRMPPISSLVSYVKALFTSQVFLGLGGEITGPRVNPESSRAARLLLMYFWVIYRPIPELPDPLSIILSYPHTHEGTPVFLVVERA
jgi:hypothetical protein